MFISKEINTKSPYSMAYFFVFNNEETFHIVIQDLLNKLNLDDAKPLTSHFSRAGVTGTLFSINLIVSVNCNHRLYILVHNSLLH